MGKRVLVEICAGSAAVSVALVGGLDAQGPSSYQGSKAGYVEPILEQWDLAPGDGADAVVLNDPGPWSRAWGSLLVEPARDEAVRKLEDWADEDPEQLWRELRATGPLDGSDLATWMVLQSWNYARKPAERGLLSFNRTGAYAPDHEGRRGTRKLAARLELASAIPWPRATFTSSTAAEDLAPAMVASWVDLAVDDELLVYIDPPYQGTARYGHRFERRAVLATAQAWADVGASVIVSEAVPLATDLGPEWVAVEITDRRRGRRRTFSRQQREWLAVRRAHARSATATG